MLVERFINGKKLPNLKEETEDLLKKFGQQEMGNRLSTFAWNSFAAILWEIMLKHGAIEPEEIKGPAEPPRGEKAEN